MRMNLGNLSYDDYRGAGNRMILERKDLGVIIRATWTGKAQWVIQASDNGGKSWDAKHMLRNVSGSEVLSWLTDWMVDLTT